jgi:hypothetical protein
METHRYYAIFSESQMIFGPPFYSEASLTTSSFLVGPEETGVIAAFHRDFDKYFREKCKPYHLGDNDLLRKQTAARTIDEEVLLAFRGALPRVLQTLEYIVGAFPMSDGGGATKEHLHAKFGIDPADANRRLREMEIAGLLMRAGDRSAGDHCHGRLATAWGISVAKKYRNYQFDLGH